MCIWYKCSILFMIFIFWSIHGYYIRKEKNLCFSGVCQPNQKKIIDYLPVWGNSNLIFSQCPWCISSYGYYEHSDMSMLYLNKGGLISDSIFKMTVYKLYKNKQLGSNTSIKKPFSIMCLTTFYIMFQFHCCTEFRQSKLEQSVIKTLN